MKKILATAALMAVASAYAVDYNGAGFAIPDLGSASSSINVPDNITITDVNVTLNNMTHTWVGDVRAILTGPGGSATLVDRIGVPPGAGDSSDFGGNYTFDSQSANNIWTTAAGLGATAVIPSGTYATTGAGSGANNNSLNAFNGQSSLGNWTLTISDHAGADVGAIGGWTLSIVPEPTSLSLLGLAGLALIRRR